jgi:hypothetical protein
MSEASDLLKERSRSYLLDLSLQIERDLTREDASSAEREQMFELGRAQFTQINALLKATLDTADSSSFVEAEREWAKMFDDLYFDDRDDDTEALEAEVLPGEAPREVRRLARYRQVLWLGLAMWAAHLYGKPEREQADDMPLQVLRILSHRFDTIETLFDVFERASEENVEDKLPWTSWFLSELPTREAHFIPTRQELLFTTVLFTTLLAGPGASTPGPRQWLTWQFDDITTALTRLDDEAERWSPLIPEQPPSSELTASANDPLQRWHDRVALARAMFTKAKSDTEADESAKVRRAPLDLERVDGFRSDVLTKTRESRLIRSIYVVQGSIERLPAPPEGHESLVAYSWLPKSSFTQDSLTSGLDMRAGDIGRDTIRAETTQLLAALDGGELRTSEQEITTEVRRAVDDLKDHGSRPSLIIIPSGWTLEQALGLRRWPKPANTHPLIPILRPRDFAGVLHGVPVIKFPTAPKDRLRVVDLAVAAQYREWPSDEDSGIQFDFKSFDTEAAEAMLAEHPEVRAKDVDDEEAIRILEERVLISLKLCWEISRGDPDGCISIAVPPELQRK